MSGERDHVRLFYYYQGILLATDIAKAGRYVVSVYRPGRDAATSNGVAFTVRK